MSEGPKLVELKTRTSDINDSVIDVLSDLLERAKAGEFSSVAIAYIRTADGLAGRYRSATTIAPAMIGAISIMLQDYVAEAIEVGLDG